MQVRQSAAVTKIFNEINAAVVMRQFMRRFAVVLENPMETKRGSCALVCGASPPYPPNYRTPPQEGMRVVEDNNKTTEPTIATLRTSTLQVPRVHCKADGLILVKLD